MSENGRRSRSTPPGAVPVYPVGAVSVRVDLDPWFTLRGVADYTSLSKRTLQDYLHDPQDPIPHVHVGARVLIQRSALDAWLRRRTCHKAEAAARLAEADARALLAARPPRNALTS